MTARRELILTLILVGVFMVCAPQLLFQGASADLLAIWMAGDHFAAGLTQVVYPRNVMIFEMLPPPAWQAEVLALQHVGQYYPYIYPPLVAVIMSWVTSLVSYETFVFWAGIVNSGLLMGSVLLAARAARAAMSLAAYSAIAILLLCVSSVALLAMHENQPQILVTFLIVLAIERSVSGHSKSAGAAMALAAAIKVYPVIFVLVWVVRRDWAAVRSFLLTGIFLAVTSVMIAGWPLHVEFLDQLGSISRTALITGWSFNLNTLYAMIFMSDSMLYVEPAAIETEELLSIGWHVVGKTATWQIVGALTAIMIAVFAALGMQKSPDREVPLWVAMIGMIALISPISWNYYYIPLLLFMPLFLERYGFLRGALLILCAVGTTIIAVPALIFDIRQDNALLLSIQVFGIIIGITAFAFCPTVKYIRPTPKSFDLAP